MAVHGNLCLAMRHPLNAGVASRALMEPMIIAIGEALVAVGALSREVLIAAQKMESEAMPYPPQGGRPRGH